MENQHNPSNIDLSLKKPTIKIFTPIVQIVCLLDTLQDIYNIIRLVVLRME